MVYTFILWTLLVVALASSTIMLWKREVFVALVAISTFSIILGIMSLSGFVTPVLEDPRMIRGLMLVSIAFLTCAPIWWYSQFSKKNQSKEGKRISPIPMGQDS